MLEFIRYEKADIGFHINLAPTKTSTWWPSIASLPSPETEFPCTIREGDCITVLGSPVGSPTPFSAAIQAELQAAQDLWNALDELCDPQMAFHILRHCAGVCRLLYLFRCTPPHLITPCAKQFDTAMRGVFERIHRPLPPHSWRQATLPLRDGGLGQTPASPTNIIAYTVSLISHSGTIKDILGCRSIRIARLLAPPYDPIAATLDMPL